MLKLGLRSIVAVCFSAVLALSASATPAHAVAVIGGTVSVAISNDPAQPGYCSVKLALRGVAGGVVYRISTPHRDVSGYRFNLYVQPGATATTGVGTPLNPADWAAVSSGADLDLELPRAQDRLLYRWAPDKVSVRNSCTI